MKTMFKSKNDGSFKLYSTTILGGLSNYDTFSTIQFSFEYFWKLMNIKKVSSKIQNILKILFSDVQTLHDVTFELQTIAHIKSLSEIRDEDEKKKKKYGWK